MYTCRQITGRTGIPQSVDGEPSEVTSRLGISESVSEQELGHPRILEADLS